MIKIIAGKSYVFDGRGYVPALISAEEQPESDPVFEREKSSFARKDEIPEMPDMSAYARKKELEQYARKADMGSEYAETFYRTEAVYVGDAVQLKEKPGYICDVKRLTVRTSWGDVQPEFCLVYDNGIALLRSLALSRAANWEFFTIEYNTVRNNKTYVPDLRGSIGRNVIIDEDSSSEYHSRRMKDVFYSAYTQLIENGGRRVFESRIEAGGGVASEKTDEVAVRFEANLFVRPYLGAAREEEVSSCPDILTVAAHYGNFFFESATVEQHGKYSDTEPNAGKRVDITTDANTFLRNTIAASAGKQADGEGIWTSYGFGVEFCEVFDRDVFDGALPAKNLTTDRAVGVVSGDMFTASAKYSNFAALLDVGDRVRVVDMGGNKSEEAEIVEIIDNRTIKLSKSLGVYVQPLLLATLSIGQTYGTGCEQSATCAIVAAKLAAIQDRTRANWQLVREAARITASNSTMVEVDGKKIYTSHWDMKRGFGIIDVAKAVEYIRQNYTDNPDYIKSAVAGLPKVNALVKFSDLGAENYVSKKQVEEFVSGLGGTGKSAYQSYLETTSDSEPMSEEEWSNFHVDLFRSL